ncbi:tetratricopeptide repeat protein [Roseibacillus ishigakijimensis]|uniref:Tetratricopeptide repeat protein n=1 Tax=Roseibacillus ishigakijimensis TaxID=454146 RepID=A0A934VLP8_9BACT|nr:tetratricopeptide repeat protein [Roseibacillus ishigakijimensis]MBK1833462.1 tetratricopeptide repeat protein [Roseibacillus ishigakijimensis]
MRTASTSLPGHTGRPILPVAMAAGLLVLLSALFYSPLASFDFISYDDPNYVTENPRINSGLSTENLAWAASSAGETNLWHPLTFASHMLDVSLFGVENAGAHHLVNLAWHAVAAAALLLLLHRLTGRLWLALLLAAFWALHPARLQSVAWISERKDVLSGAFFLLTWLIWEQMRGRPRQGLWTLVLTLSFTAACLSKPSVVPLPLVLLVAEFFREKKLSRLRFGQLLPLFGLSALTAALAIYFQQTGSLSAGMEQMMPLSRRLMLLPVSFWWYLEQFLWPLPGHFWNYPPPGTLRDWLVPLPALLILLVALWFLRRQKLVLLGMATLVLLWLPHSGIVGVSFYFVADRYSYLIHLGPLLVVVGFWIHLEKRPALQRGLTALSLLATLALAGVTWQRLPLWKNSQTLFAHEQRINPRSLLAPLHLGLYQRKNDQPEKALQSFQRALEVDPNSGAAATEAGRTLLQLARPEDALRYLRQAQRAPLLHRPDAFLMEAEWLGKTGKVAEAEQALHAGMERFPRDPRLPFTLGTLFHSLQRQPARAIPWYEKSLALQPDQPDQAEVLVALVVAHLETGQPGEAQGYAKMLARVAPWHPALPQFAPHFP